VCGENDRIVHLMRPARHLLVERLRRYEFFMKRSQCDSSGTVCSSIAKNCGSELFAVPPSRAKPSAYTFYTVPKPDNPYVGIKKLRQYKCIYRTT
jgi:hypothetical protein